MVRGYLLRSLGTFLCAPFENADKWDASGRCASLLAQAQLPLRRGANARALATIVEVTPGHWSRVEVRSEAGLEHIRILRVYLDICEASGGLGGVLWPDQPQHTTGRLPALPTMHVEERKAANRVPARSTTDLLCESLGYDDRTVQHAVKDTIGRMHHDVCVGGAALDELTLPYNRYISELKGHQSEAVCTGRSKSVRVWIDESGLIRYHL
ncbi:hypothetical protein Tcan_05141 [Toxocara canis]|uniref:Uncharacterized protein n=1 Tax=Toxocara canis TaxID=6265 RepID=A0A0B2W1V8_TOXCA|nr:hypothetical protein Tcan_05141 [Toxocara canis]